VRDVVVVDRVDDCAALRALCARYAIILLLVTPRELHYVITELRVIDGDVMIRLRYADHERCFISPLRYASCCRVDARPRVIFQLAVYERAAFRAMSARRG